MWKDTTAVTPPRQAKLMKVCVVTSRKSPQDGSNITQPAGEKGPKETCLPSVLKGRRGLNYIQHLMCCDRGERCGPTHSQQLCLGCKIWRTKNVFIQKQPVQPAHNGSWHPLTPQHSPASFTPRAHWKWSRTTDCIQTPCMLVSGSLRPKLARLKEEMRSERKSRGPLHSTGHGIHCGVREWPLVWVMARLQNHLVFIHVWLGWGHRMPSVMQQTVMQRAAD